MGHKVFKNLSNDSVGWFLSMIRIESRIIKKNWEKAQESMSGKILDANPISPDVTTLVWKLTDRV